MLEDGTTIYSYVLLSAADEEYREGYSSKHDSLIIKLPFKHAGIDKAGVLENSRWGPGSACRNTTPGARVAAAHSASSSRRSNGCDSKSITLRRLRKQRAYEKDAIEHGSPFTWSQGESLQELEQPERIKQIREDHEQRLARMKSKVQPNPLRPDSEPLDIDDLYGKAKVCLACHK